MAPIAVLIVGYRNADDICDCLRALSRLAPEPGFDVYIAENGGAAGADALLARLDAEREWLAPLADASGPVAPAQALRRRAYRLAGRPTGGEVRVAEMKENLGYAGGINAWLRGLESVAGWRAVWVLNPDTEPTAQALAELADYSRKSGKGMVASTIVRGDDPATIATLGLKWSPWHGRAEALGRGTRIADAPEARAIESQITGPSGASVFVTRELIGRIGLMDDAYFLYYEDLEWGQRAREISQIGYASRSIVPHKVGTTLGSASERKRRSPLSVYLMARNTIRFVARNFPLWLPWTVATQFAQIAAYVAAGASENATVALRGLLAGLRGETGRPTGGLSGAHRGEAKS